MTTLYLLPVNVQDVSYSLNKADLEAINHSKGLPNNTILEVEIEDSLAQMLSEPHVFPKLKTPINIPQQYYDERSNFLDNPPQWFETEGKRIYIIFNAKKECYWSPSGNNLNSFHSRNPAYYLGPAIKVSLDRESYINIYAYFEYYAEI